jgi:hypothetical protein
MDEWGAARIEFLWIWRNFRAIRFSSINSLNQEGFGGIKCFKMVIVFLLSSRSPQLLRLIRFNANQKISIRHFIVKKFWKNEMYSIPSFQFSSIKMIKFSILYVNIFVFSFIDREPCRKVYEFFRLGF